MSCCLCPSQPVDVVVEVRDIPVPAALWYAVKCFYDLKDGVGGQVHLSWGLDVHLTFQVIGALNAGLRNISHEGCALGAGSSDDY